MSILKTHILPTAILIVFLNSNPCLSVEVKCVDSSGEAAIVNNDVPSARLEALARARWNAVEQAVGVQVRARSLMQDMKLLDDVVSTRVKGFISSYKVLSEENADGTIIVRMNACVEPERASDAVASLALNRSVSVFIPARRPRVADEEEKVTTAQGTKNRRSSSRTTDEQEETNILSENLIGRLAENGYTVTDLAPTHLVDADVVEKAMRSGNYLSMRSVLYKTLSNVLLIGKADYTVSQKKGDDIGYGAENPFNRVTVRLTYRLVTRATETGQFVILGAGTAESQGIATSVEDAVSKGLNSLAEKTIPTIMDKLAKHIKGVTRKIRVTFQGEKGTIERILDLRQILSSVTWVTDVQAISLNEYTLNYPEDPLYLANSLTRDKRFKVMNFAPDRIVLRFQEQ